MFVHEAVEEKQGECVALPESSDNLEFLRCSFGGPDRAPCVDVHFPNDVNKLTGHLVVLQDSNEGIRPWPDL